MTTEKRQSPRIHILGELQGHAIVLDEPVEIREMSAGGFTMVTRSPFMIESVHDFTLVRGSDSVVVRGRVIHRRGWFERDEALYLSGIQLVEVSQETSEWLQQFMTTLDFPVSRT